MIRNSQVADADFAVRRQHGTPTVWLRSSGSTALRSAISSAVYTPESFGTATVWRAALR
jgi:hypothetical protein